ncbi:RNA degradosome polyphosphate kinase [Mangrovibacillus cuniculi]|uniref:Polyphosphate kinase n=1 Tax=Mangrovibacillus cuniculi TaxID=2593652 RepID=A0A7S8HH73_9BACI|nr:RNA degradosome polyphosphate kinase [Mangrovibacillus cuniculi]QPC48351.1 RNA degradosome polyphosphate kinase [Mangrovibacillus cuniculi]
MQFSNPIFYNNRELSWLAFNERVLQEALDDDENPLLERLKFLAIFSSNLDEFFMVRVAGLKDQVKAGYNKPENKAGMTPKEQLSSISTKTHELVELQYTTLKSVIMPELQAEGVNIIKMKSVTEEQESYLESYFDEQVFPVLTPMAVDAYRPFPMLLNKSLNLVVCLNDEEEEPQFQRKVAIVQVPAVLDRFISIPTNDSSEEYVLLEEVIAHFVWKMFKGYDVVSVSPFRITRNADMTIHEEGARDLLLEIEKELKKRKWGAAVRLEIRAGEMDEEMIDYLLDELEVHKNDLYEIDGPLDLTSLFSFIKLVQPYREHLLYPSFISQRPIDLLPDENLFEKLLKDDVFLHHPYESFEPVLDFVIRAAEDPDVLAIKQTLYRVSGDSPVIDALKKAAENGKQVTVLVELKARFDEENNVHWAKELEMAGCHVIYGMTYLKTHSKITLVVRRKNQHIERFVHLGTGNYNDQTAKLYTDMGLLTSKRKFGIDATNFFNYLSGYTEKPHFHHLVVAPFDIRDEFIQLINKEIDCHRQNGDGYILAKMNSLTDKELIMKLYEASKCGVKVDLIVRGICCLRPGIKGVSDNIRVVSIVGRFLEHSRIYYFHHSGEGKLYLSSADMMTRNMEKRVEILFPIYEGQIKKRIMELCHYMLKDNVKARKQNPDGVYQYVRPLLNERRFNSQEELMREAYIVKEDEE